MGGRTTAASSAPEDREWFRPAPLAFQRDRGMIGGMLRHPVSRRKAIAITAVPLWLTDLGGVPARGSEAAHASFIAEAFRLRDEAVAAGDQPFGAVVVLDGQIVGRGASRVTRDRDPDAHAERLALADARRALGRQTLDRAIIYSSSRPCEICQRALAAAQIARMIHGGNATDGGPPSP